MERTRRPPGRPKGSGAKPAGEKYVGWMLRMPPELRDRFRAAVPEQERAEFVRQALERALDERGAA